MYRDCPKRTTQKYPSRKAPLNVHVLKSGIFRRVEMFNIFVLTKLARTFPRANILTEHCSKIYTKTYRQRKTLYIANSSNNQTRKYSHLQYKTFATTDLIEIFKILTKIWISQRQ